MKIKVKRNKSQTHGRGLISTCDIKKGDIIFNIEGEIKKYIINSKRRADSLSYNLIGVGKNTWIKPRGFGLYCNHSCSPNSAIFNKNKVTAIRDIKIGEEITLDYALNEADIFWSFDCRCGAKNCRKKVRSIQFLSEINFKNKSKYISEYYKKVFRKFGRSKFKDDKELEDKWIDFIQNDYLI